MSPNYCIAMLQMHSLVHALQLYLWDCVNAVDADRSAAHSNCYRTCYSPWACRLVGTEGAAAAVRMEAVLHQSPNPSELPACTEQLYSVKG